jgi:hypothetical protein
MHESPAGAESGREKKKQVCFVRFTQSWYLLLSVKKIRITQTIFNPESGKRGLIEVPLFDSIKTKESYLNAR